MAGSLVGVLGNAWLAGRGVLLPAPLTTERMLDAARSDLAGGAAGMLQQALNGIPVKLYARAAGELGVDPGALLVWTALERGLRMAAATLLVWLVARRLQGWLRRCYGVYLLVTGLGFAAVAGDDHLGLVVGRRASTCGATSSGSAARSSRPNTSSRSSPAAVTVSSSSSEVRRPSRRTCSTRTSSTSGHG